MSKRTTLGCTIAVALIALFTIGTMWLCLMGGKKTTIDAKKIKRGMTRELVLSMLGQPSKDVFVATSDNVHDQWNLRDGVVAIYFDDFGFVSEITIHDYGFVAQFIDDIWRWWFVHDAPDRLDPPKGGWHRKTGYPTSDRNDLCATSFTDLSSGMGGWHRSACHASAALGRSMLAAVTHQRARPRVCDACVFGESVHRRGGGRLVDPRHIRLV